MSGICKKKKAGIFHKKTDVKKKGRVKMRRERKI